MNKLKKLLLISLCLSVYTIITSIITVLANDGKISELNPFQDSEAFIISLIIYIFVPTIIALPIVRTLSKNITNNRKLIISIIIFLIYSVCVYKAFIFVSNPF